ncbi:MAG: hypothetical protein SGBAC_008313 [Bacillariaceae sp.]
MRIGEVVTWKARLNQTVKTMKLMKTAHSNDFIVMAMFAHPDNLQFPERELIHEKSVQMIRQRENNKSNKNGVTVSSLPDRTMGAIGEMKRVQFHLTADPPRKLYSVEITGPNGGMFQLDHTTMQATVQLSSVAPPVSIEMGVRPHKVGILRAKVTLLFEGDNGRRFEIARVITMSCGYRSLNEALKPTAPYQHPKRQRPEKVHHDKKNTVGPPKEAIEDRTGGGGPSPFMDLAQYPVPSEVVDSIRENSYHQVMDSIGWKISPTHDSIQQYGEYWKYLLYASECQMQRDVWNFDLEDVWLAKEERYFVLRIPGLSEGRPSVLRGDIVNITFKGIL